MGMFSWKCVSCGDSILSSYSINPKDHAVDNSWMADAVSILPGGSILIGEYDGYGRIDDREAFDEMTLRACMYHKACWVLAGKPTQFVESKDANDQGYFFEDGKYDKPEPKQERRSA